MDKKEYANRKGIWIILLLIWLFLVGSVVNLSNELDEGAWNDRTKHTILNNEDMSTSLDSYYDPKSAKPRELQSIGKNDGDDVIAEINDNSKSESYMVMLVQIETVPPLTPDNERFDLYSSGFYGEFELRLVKNETKVDFVNLNDYFGLERIGFVGVFDIVGTDLNGDGNLDFNVGIMDGTGFNYVVFTVQQDELVMFKFDSSKVLESSLKHHSVKFKRSEKDELIIPISRTTGGYCEKCYVWDGMQFISQ
jgi:hypothetical protein